MPTKTLELQQERSRQLGRMREIQNLADAEKRSFSAEEQSEYSQLEKDFDQSGEQLEREENLAKRELQVEQRLGIDGAMLQDGAGEDRGLIINSPEYRQALVEYLRKGEQDTTPESRQLLIRGTREVRDQAKGTNSLGGYLVPIGFQKKLAMHALQAGTMRRNRAGENALVTGSGEPLQMPKTTVFGVAEWVGEGSQSSSDDGQFGQLTLNAYTARRLVKISVELAEDNAVDLEGHLAKAIGQSIGRLENAGYWVGTGTGQPTGLITGLQALGAAAKGKTGATGQTTSITADDILDLFYSVGPQYRVNSEWAMNDSTIKAIRKLKDSTGNFLFATTPGVGGALAYGTPDSLQGRPLWSDPDVPAMAAGAYSVIFGDLSAYQIRDVGVAGPDAEERPVGAFSVIRLVERFMDNLQFGYMGYHRTDGGLLDLTGAVKAYVNSAT